MICAGAEMCYHWHLKRAMTDAEREERAIWQLSQGGYHVQRQGRRYLVITLNRQ